MRAAAAAGRRLQMGYPLHPYAILSARDKQGVDYILIGSLARVLQGADEVPGGVDFVLPRGARHATDEAIRAFARPGPGSMALDGDAWVYYVVGGAPMKTLGTPAGTRGYRHLRRRGERVHLDGGLRPAWPRRGTWCR